MATVYTDEDADRDGILEREWRAYQYNITDECEEAWEEVHREPTRYRTREEELDDWNEEMADSLTIMFYTDFIYTRTICREYEDLLAYWLCYGEQLGSAYDSDAEYTYHGIML
ncbi:hypothetical protein PTNB85_10501 [Pyrenophora teres f. teres]|nr:hypothetical protein PTNB85_10501 [Pyrenophora teres f. teres]